MGIEGDSSAGAIWGGGHGGFSVKGKGRSKVLKWTARQYYTETPKEKMLEAIFKSDIKVNSRSVNAIRALKNAGEPRLIIEPGRSIAEDSGITLTKVMNIRELSGGHNMITVNAGQVNIASAMSGFTLGHWENAVNISESADNPYEAFVAGHLCFSSDMLSKFKIKFNHKPQKGELLITYNTGAYNSQFFTANTNSYPRPSRIIVMENGSVEYIKKRDTYEDIFSLNTN
jgi:diaminopimelate decarboxylase